MPDPKADRAGQRADSSVAASVPFRAGDSRSGGRKERAVVHRAAAKTTAEKPDAANCCAEDAKRGAPGALPGAKLRRRRARVGRMVVDASIAVRGVIAARSTRRSGLFAVSVSVWRSSRVRKSMVPNSRSMAGGPQIFAPIER